MKLEGTRFGTVEIDPERLIELPRGLVGFSAETSFALLEGEDGQLAWLQSTRSPEIAFPVIDGAQFVDYPKPSAAEVARSLGMDGTDLAVLVLVAVPRRGPISANLLAPIIIDLTTRRGAQAVLDPRKYVVAAPPEAPKTPGSIRPPVSEGRLGPLATSVPWHTPAQARA